jgi:hydrogenase maturation factor
LRAGKIPVELLSELLAGLPPAPSEILLGPGPGEDACALEVPPGVLVVATDPITLTPEEIGRWSVVVNANDVAVTGARPRWFLAVVLVPPGTAESALRELIADMSDALLRLGAHLVGGHTEVTPAVTRPVVVGQMLGVAEDGVITSSRTAAVGDVLVQVGPVPIEGAAVLALQVADRLEGLDATTVEQARAALECPGISVVEPALLAKRLGATALHDPTEGGLAAALDELSGAANIGLRLDRDAVLWFEPGLAVCRALDADAWSTLASGSLLAAFPAHAVPSALAEFAARGYAAAAIGIAETGSGVHDLQGRAIPWPDRDEVDRLLSSGLPRC